MTPEQEREWDFIVNQSQQDAGMQYGSSAILAADAELKRLRADKTKLLEALKDMPQQFTKTPSTLKDSETRAKTHAAINGVGEA